MPALQRHLLRWRFASALHDLLHVRAVADRLGARADGAGDLLPRLEREGDDRDEAEGEPFPAESTSGMRLVDLLRDDGDEQT